MHESGQTADRTPPILRTQSLCKVYSDGDVTALAEVSIEIRPGEYVAVVGPSGSGKSTLLHMLGALDTPTSGEVYFEGEPISTSASLDQFRSTKIGFVFQSFHLLPTLTALENVQVPMFESRRSAGERVQRGKELLAAVGMTHRMQHLPSQLSVGERQRVAIARSLANDPVVLLADEPTGNLDSETEREILQLLASVHKQRGMTLVVITHSPEVANQAERVVFMRDGRVVEGQPT